MAAVWKHVWAIDPTIDISNLTTDQIDQLFITTRGSEFANAVESLTGEKIFENKTDYNLHKVEVNYDTRQMLRCREFVDLASAQDHLDWHVAHRAPVLSINGQVAFTVISSEVVDNTTLDQVTI
jgi:hypothetical protein